MTFPAKRLIVVPELGLNDDQPDIRIPDGAAAATDAVAFERGFAETVRGYLPRSRRRPGLSSLRFGRQVSGEGRSGGLIVPNHPAFDNLSGTVSNPVTVECGIVWEDVSPLGNKQQLWTWGYRHPRDTSLNKYLTENVGLFLTGGGLVEVHWYDTGGPAVHQVRTFAHQPLSLGVPYWITFVADGTLKLYINGTLRSTLDSGGGAVPPWRINKVAWCLGSGSAFNPDFDTLVGESFRGRMEEFRVFSAALAGAVSTDPIPRFAGKKLKLADHPNADKCVALLPLDDGAGRVARDLSPLQNHGVTVPAAIVQYPKGCSGEGSLFVDGEWSALQADFNTSDVVQDEFKFSFDAAGDGYAAAMGFQLVELPPSGQNGYLLVLENGTTSNALKVWVDSTGTVRASVPNEQTGAPTYSTVVASNAIKTGSRHFFGVTKIGTTFHIVLDNTLTTFGGGLPNEGFDPRAVPLFMRVGANSRGEWPEDIIVEGVPLLVDEIRLYSRGVPVQTFQQGQPTATPLPKNRIRRDVGAKTVRLAGFPGTPSPTVSGDSAIVGLNPGDLAFFGNETVRQTEKTTIDTARPQEAVVPKGYHVASIASPDFTLAHAYEGPTSKGKALTVTDLLAYWRLEKEDQLRDRAVKHTADHPESVGTTKIGRVKVLSDLGPCGHDLLHIVSTHSNGTTPFIGGKGFFLGAPERALPVWEQGWLRPHDRNRVLGMGMFRRASKAEVQTIVAHHSSLYRFDDRWRRDQPDNGTGFSLGFFEKRDRVFVPAGAAAPSIGASFAIEAWIKAIGLDGTQTILFKGVPGDTDDQHVWFGLLDGRLFLMWTDGSGTQFAARSLEPLCVTGEWIHVTASGTTADSTPGPAGEVRVYQGGLQVGKATVGTFEPPASSGPIYLGGLSDDRHQVKPSLLIAGVRMSTIARYGVAGDPNGTRFLPPTFPPSVDGSTSALWKLGEGIDVATKEEVTGTLCDIESEPLRFLVGAMGRPKKRTVVPMATLNERLYATNGLEPPVHTDGKFSARAGLPAPQFAPRLKAISKPWWIPNDTIALITAGPTTRGAVQFYGRNHISYAIATLPEIDSSTLDSTQLRKTKLFSVMRGRWSATVDGTAILIEFVYKSGIASEALNQVRWLMGRPTKNSHAGNWSVQLRGDGSGGWKVSFTWYDSKTGAEVGFESPAGIFTDTTTWKAVAIYYVFGSAATAFIGSATLPAAPASAYTAPAVAGIGTIGINDSPGEDGSPLFIGAGPWMRRTPLPLGSVGRMAMLRYITRLVGNNGSIVTANLDTPQDVYDELPSGLAGIGDLLQNRARVIFHFGQGKGPLLRNELHFRHADNQTAGAADTQFLQSNEKAEPAIFADLDSLDGPPFVDGLYRVRTTFFDPDLIEESDPGPEAKIEFLYDPKDYPAESHLEVEGLPICPDPRERVHRRVYRTLTDGAVLTQAQEVENSDAGTAILSETAEVVAAGQVLSIRNGAAPIAAAIVATANRVVYGGLKDNPSFVAPSEPLKGESVSALSFELAETADGNPVAGLAEFIGTVLCMKRDALLLGSISIDGRLAFSRQEVAVGAASPCAIAGAEAVLVYPTEKGLYLWNGARQHYVGKAIEGTWGTLDQEDLSAAFAVYFRPENSIYALVRRRTDSFARTLIRIDLASKGNPPSTSDMVELSALAVVDDELGNPRLLAGTPDGTILELAVGEVAGVRSGIDPSRFTVQALSTTTLLKAVASTFPAIGDGAVGARVDVFYPNGQRGQTFIARVLGQDVEVQPALPADPSGAEASLGRYLRRWRSKRFDARQPGGEKWWHYANLSFLRRPNEEIRVRWWGDFNDLTPAELPFSLESGLVRVPLHKVGRTRYVQLEVVREDGPWGLLDLTLLVDDADLRG